MIEWSVIFFVEDYSFSRQHIFIVVSLWPVWARMCGMIYAPTCIPDVPLFDLFATLPVPPLADQPLPALLPPFA